MELKGTESECEANPYHCGKSNHSIHVAAHVQILPVCGLLAISEKLRQERRQRGAAGAAGSW